MKNKYARLTSKEKKALRREYMLQDKSKTLIYTKLRRVRLLGIIGLFYAILSFIYDFWFQSLVWSFVLDGLLLIFCLIFILKAGDMANSLLNRYLIDKNKKK